MFDRELELLYDSFLTGAPFVSSDEMYRVADSYGDGLIRYRSSTIAVYHPKEHSVIWTSYLFDGTPKESEEQREILNRVLTLTEYQLDEDWNMIDARGKNHGRTELKACDLPVILPATLEILETLVTLPTFKEDIYGAIS